MTGKQNYSLKATVTELVMESVSLLACTHEYSTKPYSQN